MRHLTLLSVFVIVAGCGGATVAPQAAPPDAGEDAGMPGDGGTTDGGHDVDGGALAPVTTANPRGQTHVGALAVTLTSVPAATIKYTTDGSDPTTSATATSGASPVVVTLEAPSHVTLKFFAVGTDGPSETPHSEEYALIETLNPASISGRLFVPASMQSGSASVLLYHADPHVPGNGAAITGIQTVSPNANGAPYHFDGLAAGRYWVVGGWWPGTPSGDPTAYGFARLNSVSVDPAVVANSRADFVDVYVGECDPQDTGVDGTVTIASNMVSNNVVVAAYTNAPTPGALQATPVGYALAIGTGTVRPFAMCGTPPGTVYLMAGVGPAMARPGNNAGVYQAYAHNPLSLTHVTHISFQIGEQAADLGSISGAIHLNGGLIGGTINVVATTGTGNITQQAVQALVGIDGTTDKDYTYALNNLPAGTYTLTLALKSADDLNAYSQAPSPITITLPANANVTQDLSGSVGRISGTVTVTNPATGTQNVAVVVSPVGSQTPVASATTSLGALNGGVRTADYVAFGVPDGNFSVAAIVDTNNNGTYLDDLANTCGAVAPSAAVISQGNQFTSDISVTLPGTRCP